MQADVEAALQRAANFRRELLLQLSPADRVRLLEDLFVDFFVNQWKDLLKWAALTGQTAQVDTGYIAQHIASILLGEPGQGFRGKGLDILDGTEVKSAAIISGIDRPRWNHNLGTVHEDEIRREQGKRTVSEQYLAAPNLFYLLFDRMVTNVPKNELILRVRGWCIDAQQDQEWRSLINRFLESKKGNKYNLQLHPPVGYEDDIVVNTLGNLDFADVKVFEARIHGLSASSNYRIEWIKVPPDEIRPVTGRSKALPWIRNQRPSRLSKAADVLPDIATLHELLPGYDVDSLVHFLKIETAVAAELPLEE